LQAGQKILGHDGKAEGSQQRYQRASTQAAFEDPTFIFAFEAVEVGVLIGEAWTIQDFCRKHGELPPAVLFRPEIFALIDDAKQVGMKFGILTNELELFHDKGWLETMPFAHLVDGVVDATHTNILKPDPRAYALALEALDLRAD
jgi:putative hydrolase of the HAD superfamily